LKADVLITRKHINRRFRCRADKRRFDAILQSKIDEACREYERGFHSPSIRNHADLYLAALTRGGITEARIARCRAVLSALAADLDEGGSLCAITRNRISDWLSRRVRFVEAATANQEMSILKAFANWAHAEGMWEPNAQAMLWLHMPRLKHKPQQPDPISEKEFCRLMAKMPTQIRLPWIFVWLSGDRPGAILALRWEHVHWPDPIAGFQGWIRLADRKGGAEETMHLPFEMGGAKDKILRLSRAFFHEIKGRWPMPADPIFISSRGNRWTGSAWCHAARHHQRRAGGKALKTYVARHSVGTCLMLGGESSHLIQAALGHRDGRTTAKYLHLVGMARAKASAKIEASIDQHLAQLFEDKKQGCGEKCTGEGQENPVNLYPV